MKWEPFLGGWQLKGENLCITLMQEQDGSFWSCCYHTDSENTLLIAISLPDAQREAVRNVTTHIRKLHNESEAMFQKFGKAKSVKEETEK